ncbi:MAG: hypothetical protein GC136_00240 [Alphaproteobacteria bacterium]|nr:hypothetical protein [Alphaproteobacteria bacterium]
MAAEKALTKLASTRIELEHAHFTRSTDGETPFFGTFKHSYADGEICAKSTYLPDTGSLSLLKVSIGRNGVAENGYHESTLTEQELAITLEALGSHGVNKGEKLLKDCVKSAWLQDRVEDLITAINKIRVAKAYIAQGPDADKYDPKDLYLDPASKTLRPLVQMPAAGSITNKTRFGRLLDNVEGAPAQPPKNQFAPRVL